MPTNPSLVDEIFSSLQAAFREHADPQRAAAAKRYFKEPIETHGLDAATARSVVWSIMPRIKKEASLQDAFALSEKLLAANRLEEGGAVEIIMKPFLKQLTPQHFPVLDRWVDYLTNWAVTDSVSMHVIGALIERYPELAARLVPWTGGDNRWRRRAACVSLDAPVRHGRAGPKEVFAVTDRLMLDRDDMVQKGAGWLLRDLSVRYQDEVVEYLQKYPAAGRTLVRYALEKMPEEKRRLFIPRPKSGGLSS